MREYAKTAVVVIPVYKEFPSATEQASFRQCLTVLNRYDIVIVTYSQLCCDVYRHIAEKQEKEILFQYFDEHYFQGIQGYNDLCFSVDFYNRFIDYGYMLIYQLDAWIFNDQLEYWCNKGYDYVGAPWFEDYGDHEHGNRLWLVGNGGLSLRKNRRFISLLKSKAPVFSRCPFTVNSISTIIKAFLFFFGIHNNVLFHIRNSGLNEDQFYCHFLKDTRFRLNVPTPQEALLFAFEKSPSFSFQKTNGVLPFGCHAFEKYEFMSFWKQYINV